MFQKKNEKYFFIGVYYVKNVAINQQKMLEVQEILTTYLNKDS